MNPAMEATRQSEYMESKLHIKLRSHHRTAYFWIPRPDLLPTHKGQITDSTHGDR